MNDCTSSFIFSDRCTVLRGNSSREWRFTCLGSHLPNSYSSGPPAWPLSRSGLPPHGKLVHPATDIITVSLLARYKIQKGIIQ